VGLGLLALGISTFRMSSRVGPEGVAINNGLRTRRIGWDRIEGFRYMTGRRRGVKVLLQDGEFVSLPWGSRAVSSWWRQYGEDVCKQLDDLRLRYKRQGSPS
jgi:hypothetical protein